MECVFVRASPRHSDGWSPTKIAYANKYTNDWTIKLGQSHEHQIRIQRNPITELFWLILFEHSHTQSEEDKKKKLFNEMNFAIVLALQSAFNFAVVEINRTYMQEQSFLEWMEWPVGFAIGAVDAIAAYPKIQPLEFYRRECFDGKELMNLGGRKQECT